MIIDKGRADRNRAILAPCLLSLLFEMSLFSWQCKDTQVEFCYSRLSGFGIGERNQELILDLGF